MICLFLTCSDLAGLVLYAEVFGSGVREGFAPAKNGSAVTFLCLSHVSSY